MGNSPFESLPLSGTIIGPLLYYLKIYSTFFNIPLNIWRKVEDDIGLRLR